MKRITAIILMISLLSLFSFPALAYGEGGNDGIGIDTYIVWGVIVGFVVSAIVVAVIVKKYKTKLKAPIYPLSSFARLNLLASRDTFLGKHVTSVRVNTGNSNRRKR